MLLDRHGARPDPWTRADAPGPGATLLGWEAFLACRAAGHDGAGLAAELPNHTDPTLVQPHFAALALLAIRFPTFADGRGFTLARRLRRLGYRGNLRAVGPLIPDQFAHVLACGFDEVDLPAASAGRQSPAQWQRALAARSLAYQSGHAGEQISILARRRLAREAANG
jgi:uncharacterized protein (DUF934 family)